MSLQFFDYNGLKLTVPEIRLLKLVESRRAAHRQVEEEKRAERILLSQSLQSSMLMGMHMDLEKKKEIVEIPITQSETYIPTHEELRAIKEAHLSKHDDSFHGDDGDDEEVSNAMDVSDNVHIYTSITSTSQMNIDGVKIPKKKLEVSERSSTNQKIIEQNSSSSSSSRDTSGISTTDIRIRKKQRILSDPSDDAILPKTYGLDSIFSVEGLLSYEDWSPQISKNTSLVHLLNNFSLEDYQTVALKMSVTPNNGRWSVNVCPEDPMEMTDVYIHFNPRYKSNEVVLNDVQGTWGGAFRRQMSGRMSTLRASTLEVIIQVRKEGYFIFVNNSFLTMFRHRRDPFLHRTLSLLVPATDGMGRPEDLVVHKVWWGRVLESALVVPPAMLQQAVAAQSSDETGGGPSAGLPISDYRWDRTVVVSGLPPFTDPVEVYELEKALYTLFADYAPEAILVVGGKGLAYARLSSRDAVVEASRSLEGSLVADFTLHLEPGPLQN